jgi:hypothetical protein
MRLPKEFGSMNEWQSLVELQLAVEHFGLMLVDVKL